MDLDLHPDIRLRKLSIGAEGAPLLVIDNLVNEADALVEHAAGSTFSAGAGFYPGIRVAAPAEYQQLILTRLGQALLDCLGVRGGELQLSMCHYSLVTTPADKLIAPQRIGHVDSLSSRGLATIHYLFKSNLGGTAFYRHRKTGFAYIDDARRVQSHAGVSAQLAAFRQHRRQLRAGRESAHRAAVDQQLHRPGVSGKWSG